MLNRWRRVTNGSTFLQSVLEPSCKEESGLTGHAIDGHVSSKNGFSATVEDSETQKLKSGASKDARPDGSKERKIDGLTTKTVTIIAGVVHCIA